MKETKILSFSKSRFTPYILEDRDIDRIAKMILGAFEVTFNFYDTKTNPIKDSKGKAKLFLDPEEEISGLKQTLEKYVKKYACKVKIENMDMLRDLITERLISDYLKDKAQGKMVLINEVNLKKTILECIEECSKSIRYCP
ncbi:MAG: hypothetical protein ABSA84_06315 [Gammaproteobacteria bacterium]